MRWPGGVRPVSWISAASVMASPNAVGHCHGESGSSFRDVEDLTERGIMVSYETVRRWVNHFGPVIFQLVPWTPSLEKQLGRHVSGVARGDGGIDWGFGRNRGLAL
jgi:Protein of unknown function (DUF3363)